MLMMRAMILYMIWYYYILYILLLLHIKILSRCNAILRYYCWYYICCYDPYVIYADAFRSMILLLLLSDLMRRLTMIYMLFIYMICDADKMSIWWVLAIYLILYDMFERGRKRIIMILRPLLLHAAYCYYAADMIHAIIIISIYIIIYILYYYYYMIYELLLHGAMPGKCRVLYEERHYYAIYDHSDLHRSSYDMPYY